MPIKLYACGLLLAGWLAALCGLGTARDAAAALIQTEVPCTSAAGYCLKFFASTPMPLIIRTFDFTAPSAGTAWVTFQGSLVCSSFGSQLNVIQLISQIVLRPTAAPIWNGSGGLKLVFGLIPTQSGTTNSVNLASARGDYFASAGTKTYAFKIDKVAMPGSTVCYVYDAAFTVVFAP